MALIPSFQLQLAVSSLKESNVAWCLRHWVVYALVCLMIPTPKVKVRLIYRFYSLPCFESNLKHFWIFFHFAWASLCKSFSLNSDFTKSATRSTSTCWVCSLKALALFEVGILFTISVECCWLYGKKISENWAKFIFPPSVANLKYTLSRFSSLLVVIPKLFHPFTNSCLARFTCLLVLNILKRWGKLKSFVCDSLSRWCSISLHTLTCSIMILTTGYSRLLCSLLIWISLGWAMLLVRGKRFSVILFASSIRISVNPSCWVKPPSEVSSGFQLVLVIMFWGLMENLDFCPLLWEGTKKRLERWMDKLTLSRLWCTNRSTFTPIIIFVLPVVPLLSRCWIYNYLHVLIFLVPWVKFRNFVTHILLRRRLNLRILAIVIIHIWLMSHQIILI